MAHGLIACDRLTVPAKDRGRYEVSGGLRDDQEPRSPNRNPVHGFLPENRNHRLCRTTIIVKQDSGLTGHRFRIDIAHDLAATESSMPQRENLQVHDGPQTVMTNLRRVILLGHVGVSSTVPLDQRRQLQNTFEAARLGSVIGDAHVYDTARLWDFGHSDALTWEQRNLLGNEWLDHPHLFLPHPVTVFLTRFSGDSRDGAHLFGLVLTQASTELTIWAFAYDITKSSWEIVGVTGIGERFSYEENILYHGIRHAAGIAAATLGLLNRKTDVVLVEPAEWITADDASLRLKAFQTPIGLNTIKVNTPRLLLTRPRDDDGSGAVLRPHDRRAHERRRGSKIIKVRACKIHGGTLIATAKVMTVAEAIR
jgi:hypothetical protein